MVVPLGPGKFYGTSLPRPRIYTDVKFSDDRVDPPLPVTDALLSWASEAHWSMGGLSFKRLRLQGRIEGSVSKLRASTRTKPSAPDSAPPPPPMRDSPPPAPVAFKRRRFAALIEEEEEEEEEERRGRVRRRRLVKKLGDDFDRVASETAKEEEEEEEAVAEVVNKVKSRGKNSKSEGESGAVKPRSSPRLRSSK